MNDPTARALWAAINRVRDYHSTCSQEVKNVIFREHFVDAAREGDTAGYAKEEVAALLGDLRLKGEPQ